MQVKRAGDNMSFLQNKSHTIVNDNKDGTGTVKRNIYAAADRIWLDEEFSCNYGMAYKYKLKFANQLCQEKESIIERIFNPHNLTRQMFP